jgi:hypothetical protein
MEDYVLTKENLKQLKVLKKKQYQYPELLSKEETVLISKLERMKYSKVSSTDGTPAQAKTPTSDCTTSDSNKSQYALLVDENRLWRQAFSSRKLSDYDKEMEKNIEHFKAAATFCAAFLIFIRYITC